MRQVSPAPSSVFFSSLGATSGLSTGSSGSASAAHQAAMILQCHNDTTYADVYLFREAIGSNEKSALAEGQKHEQPLLGKLSMPEDIAIRWKRLTGLRLTDE